MHKIRLGVEWKSAKASEKFQKLRSLANCVRLLCWSKWVWNCFEHEMSIILLEMRVRVRNRRPNCRWTIDVGHFRYFMQMKRAFMKNHERTKNSDQIIRCDKCCHNRIIIMCKCLEQQSALKTNENGGIIFKREKHLRLHVHTSHDSCLQLESMTFHLNIA